MLVFEVYFNTSVRIIFAHPLPFIIPVPFELEVHTVPHFKAPVNCKVEPRGPEHGGIFIL